MSEKQGIPPPVPYVAGAPPAYYNLYPAPPTYVPDAPPIEHFQPEHQKQMPTAMGAATERVVETPPPPQLIGQQKTNTNTGLTGALMSVVNDIGRGIDSVARVVQSATSVDLMHFLTNGSIIQLGNPKTRSAVEIVVSPITGFLMVDCRGPVDRAATHAHWTVYRESTTNIVRLYNHQNFLAVVNNELTLIQAASPKEAPMTTRFRVRHAGGQLCLESLAKPAHYIVVEPSDLSLKLKEVFTINPNSYFLLYIVQQGK